jgi:hypothetical protein
VRRTPVKMVAVALAAGAVLTACSSTRLGSAAVMSNQRITSAHLSAQVSELNQGYQKYRNQIQLQFPAGQMPQQVLGWLVRFRVRDELAARNHITVTPGEVQRALDAIRASSQSQSSGGPAVPLPALAVENGLPPDLLTDLARYQAIQAVLVNRLDGGTVPSGAAAQQALTRQFTTSECHAAKALNIRINPQYGRLDYSQFSIIPAPSGVSATGGPTPSPSPSSTVQLTPHC